MCDEWMPALQLPLSWEQFLQLPRNAAYKYEYLEGKAFLRPRPKHYHALLDLLAFCPPADCEKLEDVVLRPLTADDIPSLEPAFVEAFHRIQPFGSLDDAMQREAAHQCLKRTRTGGDGPWIEQASVVAIRRDNAQPCGAIFITLLPPGDPSDWDSYYWTEPPAADCIARRLGRPHLTWIFVAPASAGHSVGTALLAAAVRVLLSLGYTQLATTFLLGNASSMLWHWRNGFQLLPYPASPRRVRQRLRQEQRE
jgi:GNAT superfamily N-acetyltransferase